MQREGLHLPVGAPEAVKLFSIDNVRGFVERNDALFPDHVLYGIPQGRIIPYPLVRKNATPQRAKLILFSLDHLLPQHVRQHVKPEIALDDSPGDLHGLQPHPQFFTNLLAGQVEVQDFQEYPFQHRPGEVILPCLRRRPRNIPQAPGLLWGFRDARI